MKVIQVRAAVGDDHLLRVQLPKDTPVGTFDVVLVLQQPSPDARTVVDRRAAFDATLGMLQGEGDSIHAFLAERRADEQRRVVDLTPVSDTRRTVVSREQVVQLLRHGTLDSGLTRDLDPVIDATIGEL